MVQFRRYLRIVILVWMIELVGMVVMSIRHFTWNEPGELYIDYIEFKFIETFISRDRGIKLDSLLNMQDHDIFNI